MFAQTDTQAMLASMVGRLLAEHNEFEKRRHRLTGPAPDRMALWPVLAEQGILGAGVAEEVGGFGGSVRDIATVMALAGEWLVVEPLLSSWLALHVLSAAGEQALIDEAIGGGKLIVFASIGDRVVRHGDLADAVVLDTPSGFRLVDPIAATPFRLIDGSSAVTIDFGSAPGRLLVDDPALRDAVRTRALIGIAAEGAGLCRAASQATFAYLKTRKQFGMPLAAFQALQHRAVDMHIAGEELRILVNAAVAAADVGAGNALALACAAKASADAAARKVTHEAVQMHGGMGVSDELNISHYLRRAAAMRTEHGDAGSLRAEFHAAQGVQGLLLAEKPEIASFRAEVREFVRANLPDDLAAKGRSGLEIVKDDYVRWQKILRDKGWFAAAWGAEFGGAGWDLERQLVFVQEAALNNAPMIIPYGVNMVGPVLQAFGSREQQQAHLPGILSSDVWWCQGYSEPNSGSDLASLKTAAVRDGDHWVVNGTKMWTTEAHWADMMHCLVRTDREVKPQKGISFLLIDMTTPGITIRPIVTIDGQHHTNQLFFDDVRVPVANLVGGEGQGWTIAKFLLSNERVAIADTGSKLRLLGVVQRMFEVADLTETQRVLLRDRLAAVEIELLTLCAMEQAYVGMWAEGASKAGPEASILKIRGTEILQALTEVALAIEGPLGGAHDPEDLHLPTEISPTPAQQVSMLAHQYLYGRCWSIFGGTNEIQRNIIAGILLG